jgi:hypothetical protein
MRPIPCTFYEWIYSEGGPNPSVIISKAANDYHFKTGE